MVKAMDCRSELSLKDGSFPGTGDFFFIFYFSCYDDDGGATQASAKRECHRAGMSAANVGASGSASSRLSQLALV